MYIFRYSWECSSVQYPPVHQGEALRLSQYLNAVILSGCQRNWSKPPVCVRGVCVIWACVCVVGSNIIRERVRFEVKMHPVSVSIPSFRSETSPMEKGFTVSCPTTTSVCLSAVLLLSSGLFFHFFHSNVASVSCWDGFCHLRAASDFGSLIKKR